MKFIKNIFAASAVILAGTAFTACDDFLDIEPENTVPEEKVDFTNISNMYQPVSGAYATLRTNHMHWAIGMEFVIRDDDVWNGNDDGGDFYNMSEHYIYNAGNWALDEIWKQFYGMVKTCNSALISLDEYAKNITSEADMKTYRSYCGEVRILRALAYYRLTQFFGDCTLYHTNTMGNLRRAKRDVIYEYMLQDLQYAIDNCQRKRPNEMDHKGAFTVYTAEALAAKVYLNLGQYDKVETLTQDIINNGNFELYSDYYQMWKIPGRLCNESLMECQCTDFGEGNGDYIGIDQYFNCMMPSMKNDNTVLKTYGGWKNIGFYDEFVQWAKDRGEKIRFTTTFLQGGTTTPSGDYIEHNTNLANTDCWNGKWYVPLEQITEGRTGFYNRNNVRVIRYAEVLLMNAEAKVRQGKNGDAPFNEIRRRAEMPELTNVTVDQILDERRMELACEWGERYNDLIRCGLAEKLIGPKGWTPAKTYLPVPSAQIDVSRELKEEPFATLQEALDNE